MPRIDDYKAALTLVQKQLAGTDPREVAGRSQARFEERQGAAGLVLPYFGWLHWIEWPTIRVGYLEGGGRSTSRNRFSCCTISA